MPKPDDWEVEYETWLTRRNLSQGLLKEYPRQAKQEAADKRMAEEEQKQFNPVPLVTKADASGDLRTMKRRLDQRLYLMVRRKVEGGREAWRFPQAQHQPGETLSATSERAIQDTVGRNYPIFHIGHAPLGWLPLWTAQGGKLFFQLAQVVDDPWPLSKMPAGVLDWGWVTKAEAQDKVEDARLSELLGRML